jgi:hypothetical protein
MSSLRDVPFSFSAEARDVLGSPDALNLAVRAAFPELGPGWAGVTATYCDRGLTGRSVVTRAGTCTPARTILGLFAGTIFMGDEPRGFNTLPLPLFRAHGVEVRCFVDGSSRAARCPSAAEAVLYRHVCDDTAATLMGEWWLGGPEPCLLARAASNLPQRTALQWNFDSHGASRSTLSQPEARLWRRDGHSTECCRCGLPRDCPFGRFLRVADIAGSSDDSDW